jgi:hypothetical protein
MNDSKHHFDHVIFYQLAIPVAFRLSACSFWPPPCLTTTLSHHVLPPLAFCFDPLFINMIAAAAALLSATGCITVHCYAPVL